MDKSVLQLLFLSKHRMNILLFLKTGPKTIREINEFLELSSIAVLPQIKMLRDNFLILKDKNVYSLSPLGIAIVHKTQPMLDLLNVFGTQYDYWTSHAIECIPVPFQKRIGDLVNCTFSKPPDKTRLFEPHKEFVENLKKANKISGIASIFHPYYPSMFSGFAKLGIDVSILVTSQVYERIREEFEDVLREFLKSENGTLYVCSEKIEFSYAVTDKFLSLSLPFSDGIYDHQRDILCFDPIAIKWGEDLYSYFRDISDEVIEI